MKMATQLPVGISAQDLSRVNAFSLGPLQIDPPTRKIAVGGKQKSVEPRVMQVLVALGLEPGLVLSRDDLINLCWDGRIVGDNAVNRVISLLRQALAEVAGSMVQVETITKVGFRVTIQGTGGEAAPPSARFGWHRYVRPTRRTMVIGGFAALAAIGAGGGWAAIQPSILSRSREPKPAALELYERGVGISRSAIPGQNRQAMTFYRRAVAIDPQFADAWGALAFSYIPENRIYAHQVESAAKQALALDPDQPEANVALILSRPVYQRWQDVGPRLERLVRRFPDSWHGHFAMGSFYQDVGFFEKSIRSAQRAVELDPLMPIGWVLLSEGFAHAGQWEAADAALEQGFQHWPDHILLWFARYGSLIASDRFEEAASFSRDQGHYPPGLGEEFFARYIGFADALSERDTAKLANARKYFRDVISSDEVGAIEVVPRFAPLLAAMGARDDALTSFEAYLLGGKLSGRTVPAPRPVEKRFTRALFSRPILAARGAQFDALLHRTGLEEYWRRSGSQPDIRRG